MEKLKVAIYGTNGHQITQKLKNGTKTQWVAAAGIPKEIIEQEPAYQTGELKYFETLDELLAHSDAQLVSLCSPMRSEQAADAIKVLRAKKHVYAEKPAALDNGILDEILHVAEENGVEFHEIADTAFFEPYWTFRKVLQSGKIGEVVQVYVQKSYPQRDGMRPQDENEDGGLTRQVGIHAMRFIEHVVGLHVIDAQAMETKLGSIYEGNLHMASSWILQLENGGVASACINYFNPKGFPGWGNETLRVFGTKGMMEITNGGQATHLYTDDGDFGPLELSNSDCPEFWDLYVDHLLTGSPMPMTIEEELHPLRVVNQIKANIREVPVLEKTSR